MTTTPQYPNGGTPPTITTQEQPVSPHPVTGGGDLTTQAIGGSIILALGIIFVLVKRPWRAADR